MQKNNNTIILNYNYIYSYLIFIWGTLIDKALTCGGGCAGVIVKPLAVRARSSLNSGGNDLSLRLINIK